MGLTIKADDQTIPAIASFFGLQAPPDNYIMAPDASGNPAPLPPSPGKSVTQPPPATDTKLGALTQLLSGTAPSGTPPVIPADNSVPIPGDAMGNGEALPPPDLAQSMVSNVQPPRKATFADNHPALAKFLSGITEFAQDAGPGVGAPTFGQGFATAAAQPEIRAQRRAAAQRTALQNFIAGQQIADIPLNRAAKIAGIKKTMADTATAEATANKAGYLTAPDGAIYQITDDGKTLTAVHPGTPKPPTPEADKLRTRQLEKKLSDGSISAPDRQDLIARQQEEKMQGVGSEIIAQAGRPPVPAQYLRGQDDPGYKAANVAWGKSVEAIKNREAAARGEGYNLTRPVAVINPNDGSITYMLVRDAIAGGAAPAAQGAKAMSQQQQFSEMHVAAQKAEDAINNLDRDFTPTQIAKLTLAFSHNDPTITSNEINTIFGTQQLTPKQQDFVIWLNQLNERAMSLRNVAGMGQGSQDLRQAIQNTLPSLRSGSKQMALKQLDAFKNQVSILEKGIPKVKTPNNAPGGGSPSAKAAAKKWPGFVPDQ